jgi:hypothetical protein
LFFHKLIASNDYIKISKQNTDGTVSKSVIHPLAIIVDSAKNNVAIRYDTGIRLEVKISDANRYLVFPREDNVKLLCMLTMDQAAELAYTGNNIVPDFVFNEMVLEIKEELEALRKL